MSEQQEPQLYEPDYEYLGRCQFPGGYMGSNGQEADCGEIAVARIWWDDYDASMLACSNHFTEVTGRAI